MRRACLLLLFAFLAVAARAQGDKYAGIKTIGVISDIGNGITLEQFGATAFGNSTGQATLDWDIDAQITAQVTRAVAGRFTVKPVSFDANLFAEIPTLWHTFTTELQSRVMRLPASNGVDAYVIVLRDKYPFFMTKDYKGLGLRHSKELFGNSDTQIYAVYDIAVVDARTGETLAIRRALPPGHDPDTRGLLGAFCDSSIWSQSAAGLDSNQKSELRQELTALILSSLPQALQGVGLPPAAPGTDTDSPSGLSICKPMP